MEGVSNYKTFLTSACFAGVVTAASGYLAGRFFHIISPMGGAIFGGVSAVSGTVLDAVLEKTFIDTENGKTLKKVISIFGSIAIAAFVTTFAGFPITFEIAIILSLAMIPTSILVGCIIGCFATSEEGNNDQTKDNASKKSDLSGSSTSRYSTITIEEID